MLNIQPFKTKVTARKTKNDYPDTIVGEGTVICPSARICAGVVIGKNCLICSNVVIREGGRIGDNVLISNNVTLNYNVTIGNNVKVLDLCHLTGGMIIGDNVFLSCGVMSVNDKSIGKRDKSVACNAPIIHSGVRVGAGAIILSGIEIKKNALIAAGAVVTKNVKEGAKVFGIPAREK